MRARVERNGCPVGNTRGKKSAKRGQLKWSNRKANKGRKPAMGKRKGMVTWAEVRPQILRAATKIVVPPKPEETKAE